MILTTAAVAVEQVSKYWRRDNKLPVTKVGYAGQLLSNFLALVVIV
ncbi:PTS system cellobiose-specific transporter subunit IIC, partial [Lacticaseibacillus rhamnosus MTCC 5462]